VLVVDAAALFASATGVDAVRAALDGAWDAIHPHSATAKLILLLAPRPGDAHAEAARAGLENLARTLSIEWARNNIRPVAIHPGTATAAEEIAELAAFLSSAAGAYYSGCRFDLH
jgi:NAD(P)-dependent dehydrogenase (short-subunit alcohol dehydrogenase family)